MMRQLLRQVIHLTYRPWLQKYLSRDRAYRYRDTDIIVKAGVFHPGFFYSTKMLLDFLLKEGGLEGKSLLELGCGSGLISVVAARNGAVVTASDISLTALKNTTLNCRINNVDALVLESDLFDQIPLQQFDWILINPPYYLKDPEKPADYAWYCGRGMEYFKKLFNGLRGYLHPASQALMVLSDVCDIRQVKKVAGDQGFKLAMKEQKRKGLEWNFVYGLEQQDW